MSRTLKLSENSCAKFLLAPRLATIASIATLGNHIATAANVKPQVGAESPEILSAPNIAATATIKIPDAK